MAFDRNASNRTVTALTIMADALSTSGGAETAKAPKPVPTRGNRALRRFLAADEAGFVTGSTLTANGGNT